MSTSPKPRREHPSTYMVQDRSNQQELTRVTIQDQMLTSGMGGVLPEQPDATRFQRVLDVGCGTGCWLIEAARTYPTMTLLVGVDVSGRMIEHARALAASQQVEDRVRFAEMDALRMLEFPSDSFDLVNQRLGASYLRTWEWPKLLQEYQRVTRPGGVIRITESNMVTESSSPAMLRFNSLIFKALCQAGHYFTKASNGVTSQLAPLLHQHGFQNVQTHASTMEYRAGTPEGENFYEDAKRATQTLLPFLKKWTHVPEDYETLCQQLLSEIQQSDVVTTWRLLTAWGTKNFP
jgi:ubiquinone/menaquinone biosynthesis C-methylase UbiE